MKAKIKYKHPNVTPYAKVQTFCGYKIMKGVGIDCHGGFFKADKEPREGIEMGLKDAKNRKFDMFYLHLRNYGGLLAALSIKKYPHRVFDRNGFEIKGKNVEKLKQKAREKSAGYFCGNSPGSISNCGFMADKMPFDEYYWVVYPLHSKKALPFLYVEYNKKKDVVNISFEPPSHKNFIVSRKKIVINEFKNYQQ